MNKHLNRRRIKAVAFLAAGALVAVPAIAATITAQTDEPANLRLIEAAREIGQGGTNETTWEGDHTWRLGTDDDGNPIREIRMTWPREAAVLPFNLFAHDGIVPLEHAPPGTNSLVEGGGPNRIIVPGDYGSTWVRVHNDGPTAGILRAYFRQNLLHNLEGREAFVDAQGRPVSQAEPGLDANANPLTAYEIDPAYDFLFINGVPASTFFADREVQIAFHGTDGIAIADIPIDAGGYVDLPFDWSFFAFEGDEWYRIPHNIGNYPYTRADFQLNLDISGSVTQLTVLKAVEGPDLPAAFVGIEPGADWQVGVFSVGHTHDDATHAPSAEFSGLYQTAAMRGEVDSRWAQYGSINASATTGLLVSPDSLYTAVLLNSASLDFLLHQGGKNHVEIGESFATGALSASQITQGERDVFGDYIGSLQCVLLGPFTDATGSRSVVGVPGDGGWADSVYGGRNGLVQVPDNHHAVCEKVSRTSVLNVEKIVYTFNAAGEQVLTGGAAPVEWQINITPVYVAGITSPAGADIVNLDATHVVDGQKRLIQPGSAAHVVSEVAVGLNNATSSDMRILPTQQYRIDLIAPDNRIVDGYELVDAFLTTRAISTDFTAEFPAGRPRSVRVAGFVPFGTTLMYSPTRVNPPDGVTASWLLPFNELSAQTITFVSHNLAAVTTPPIHLPGTHHPGQVLPGRTVLAMTGADIAFGLLAAAGLALGATLVITQRKRNTTKAEG